MKMQKVDMEFVTFDARDVIATSGGSDPVTPITDLNVWVRGSVFEAAETNYNWGILGPGQYFPWVDVQNANGGNILAGISLGTYRYYQIVGGSKVRDYYYEVDVNTDNGRWFAPQGSTTLEGSSDLLAWLSANVQ